MFSQRMRIVRKGKKMSQRELAKKLYVSPQAVSKWENGLSSPNPETIVKMADIFDVSADYLLDRMDNPDDDGKDPPGLAAGGEREDRQCGDPNGASKCDRELSELLKRLTAEQKKHLLGLLRTTSGRKQEMPASSCLEEQRKAT